MRDLFEEYLSEEEVAEFMGIKVTTLRNKISEGKDHPPVIKGMKKFNKESFFKWLQEREKRQKNEAS